MGSRETIKIISAVITNNVGEVLLVKRGMNTNVWPGKWHTVSGKLEDSESDDRCFFREIEEEVGISEVDIVKKVVFKDFQLGNLYVTSLYLCTIGDKNITLSDENTDYRWVNVKDLGEIDLSPVVIDDVKRLGLLE